MVSGLLKIPSKFQGNVELCIENRISPGHREILFKDELINQIALLVSHQHYGLKRLSFSKMDLLDFNDPVVDLCSQIKSLLIENSTITHSMLGMTSRPLVPS